MQFPLEGAMVKPKPKREIQISDEELLAIGRRAVEMSKAFGGQAPDLESAIGMLFVGRLFGWKVLYLIHSRRTVDKYAKILGIDNVQGFFPPDTTLSSKSIGFQIANALSNFWKAVKGEYPGKDARNQELAQ